MGKPDKVKRYNPRTTPIDVLMAGPIADRLEDAHRLTRDDGYDAAKDDYA